MTDDPGHTISEKVTISLPKLLLAAAKKRWPGKYSSFSAYVQHLIRQDLESEDEHVAESPPTYLARDDRLAAAMEQQTAILRKLLERSTQPAPLRLMEGEGSADESASSPKPRRKAH